VEGAVHAGQVLLLNWRVALCVPVPVVTVIALVWLLNTAAAQFVCQAFAVYVFVDAGTFVNDTWLLEFVVPL
jgi:hypothetical protein